MFGRRKRRASAAATPPGLARAEILAAVRSVLDEQIGASGRWSLVRRDNSDEAVLFHEAASASLSREVSAAVAELLGVTDAEEAETIARLRRELSEMSTTAIASTDSAPPPSARSVATPRTVARMTRNPALRGLHL